MVHFVIFETLTSNYEISIKEYYVYTRCCDISNYFVKNAQFRHFLRGPCSFFTFSKLSKIAHFVILWDARVFFRFFNFVKNAQFCHFLRGQCIFFNFSIFVKNGPFCHFWNVDFKLWDKYKYSMCTVCVVIYQTILSKMLNFVIFWETRVFFRFFSFVKNA